MSFVNPGGPIARANPRPGGAPARGIALPRVNPGGLMQRPPARRRMPPQMMQRGGPPGAAPSAAIQQLIARLSQR